MGGPGNWLLKGPVGLILIAIGGLLLYGDYYLYDDHLQSENAQFAADLEDVKAERDRLSEELTKANTRIAQLSGYEADSKRLASQLAEMTTAHDGAVARATTLDQDLSAERERSSALIAELSAESAKRSEAEERAKRAWLVTEEFTLSEAQREELDRVRAGIARLNSELTLIQIQPTPWPIISGLDAVATFEIYRKDFASDASSPRGAGLFLFDSERD